MQARQENVQSDAPKENYGLMQPVDGEDGHLKGVKFITPRLISPVKKSFRNKDKYVLSSKEMIAKK